MLFIGSICGIFTARNINFIPVSSPVAVKNQAPICPNQSKYSLVPSATVLNFAL